MKIISIVAVSENNVIGVNGRIPWHIPKDLRRFREETTGHAVIMGRKTAESLKDIGKFPLPDRVNIVASKSTQDKGFARYYLAPKKHVVVHDIDDAIRYAKCCNLEKAFLIGGENIYREGLQYCDEVLLTRVHETVEYGPDDVVARFDSEWLYINNFKCIESPGQTEDGRATFYRYARVR